MVGSVGFVFFEFEKKDNVTWVLEVSWNMLKDQANMSHVIVVDRDVSLINSVVKVYPTS